MKDRILKCNGYNAHDYLTRNLTMNRIVTAFLTATLIVAPSFAAAKQFIRTRVNQFKSYVEPFTLGADNAQITFVNGYEMPPWVIHVFVNEYTSNGNIADKVTFFCNDMPIVIEPGKNWSTCTINSDSTATLGISLNDMHFGANGVLQVD